MKLRRRTRWSALRKEGQSVVSGLGYYTHVSDQHRPYNVRVMLATSHEAPYALDGLMHPRTAKGIWRDRRPLRLNKDPRETTLVRAPLARTLLCWSPTAGWRALRVPPPYADHASVAHGRIACSTAATSVPSLSSDTPTLATASFSSMMAAAAVLRAGAAAAAAPETIGTKPQVCVAERVNDFDPTFWLI